MREQVEEEIAGHLVTVFNCLECGKGSLPLSKLRLSAKSFAPPELEKELQVNRLIEPWMSEVLVS